MTVNIDIDLNSRSANVKLGSLKAQIEALDEDLSFDIDVDDISEKLDNLTDGLSEIDIDVDYSDLKKAAALKAMLEGDIETDLNLNQDTLDQIKANGLGGQKSERNWNQLGPHGFDFDQLARTLNSDKDRSRIGRMREKNLRRANANGGRSGFRRFNKPNFEFADIGYSISGPGDDDFVGPDFDGFGSSSPSGSKNSFSFPGFGSRGDKFNNISIKKQIKRAVPSMSTFYNLFAAMIPVLISAGTQLAGVAASMGSVAIAGGSILALGLVGHGEDMASSWKKAKEQLSTLKKEMFQTFQPTMQTFAPIQAEFFDMLPQQMNKVATSMQGLTNYSDTLFASLRGVTGWISQVFDVIVNNEDKISQLTMRFGGLIGSSAIDFFKFIVQEGYNSQDMLVRLGVIVKSILTTVYEFSNALASGVSALTMFTGVISFLGDLFNNKIAAALFGFATIMGTVVLTVMALTKSVSALIMMMNVGFVSMIAKAYTSLTAYIFKALTTAGANYALAASFAAVAGAATMGLGAILGIGGAMKAMDSVTPSAGVGSPVGGGVGGGGRGSSRGSQTVINEGDNVNVRVDGNMDNATQKGLGDIFSSDVNTTREK